VRNSEGSSPVPLLEVGCQEIPCGARNLPHSQMDDNEFNRAIDFHQEVVADIGKITFTKVSVYLGLPSTEVFFIPSANFGLRTR
jgi:hypothetical protein